jgi:hypothetical protein
VFVYLAILQLKGRAMSDKTNIMKDDGVYVIYLAVICLVLTFVGMALA